MSTYVYVIDQMDRIISLSSNWLSFAMHNNAGESCHPDRIINKPIWTFIDGKESLLLYEICITNVRLHKKPIVLPFRCDAPDRRRYLELKISPLPRSHIEFASCVIREEPGEGSRVLQHNIPRSNDFITMCSMCKKVHVCEKDWIETEEAIARLRLFEMEVLPQITHGLCQNCFRISMDEIERIRVAASRNRDKVEH